MNAAGRRLSESRVRENLMHGLRWQAMETETTAPSLDPTIFVYKPEEMRNVMLLLSNRMRITLFYYSTNLYHINSKKYRDIIGGIYGT